MAGTQDAKHGDGMHIPSPLAMRPQMDQRQNVYSVARLVFFKKNWPMTVVRSSVRH